MSDTVDKPMTGWIGAPCANAMSLMDTIRGLPPGERCDELERHLTRKLAEITMCRASNSLDIYFKALVLRSLLAVWDGGPAANASPEIKLAFSIVTDIVLAVAAGEERAA